MNSLKKEIQKILEEKQRATFKEIAQSLGMERSRVSNIISNLLLEDCDWTLEKVGARIYLTLRQSHNICLTHRDGVMEEVKPKVMPKDGDWVVKNIFTDNILYFDKKYNHGEVKTTAALIWGLQYIDIRPKHYTFVACDPYKQL